MADTHEPRSEHERRLLERAGTWVVIGVIGAMIAASLVLFTLRPHTVMLTPGQPQSPMSTVSGQ